MYISSALISGRDLHRAHPLSGVIRLKPILAADDLLRAISGRSYFIKNQPEINIRTDPDLYSEYLRPIQFWGKEKDEIVYD